MTKNFWKLLEIARNSQIWPIDNRKMYFIYKLHVIYTKSYQTYCYQMLSKFAKNPEKGQKLLKKARNHQKQFFVHNFALD